MSTSSQAEPTFTRSKGGTAEREEIISQIQVPDLWKIAEVFQGKSNTMYMSKANREAVADAILECWHLAHDMRKHLQSNGEAQKATVEDLPGYCGRCIQDRLASDVDYGQVFESFRAVSSDDCEECAKLNIWEDDLTAPAQTDGPETT